MVYILGAQYRYEVTEIQIKRCLNEIMDLYRFKKVKANKLLKEQYGINSDGYPNIIVKDYCAIIGLNQKDLENQGILA